MKKYFAYGSIALALIIGGILFADYREQQAAEQNKQQAQEVLKIINETQAKLNEAKKNTKTETKKEDQKKLEQKPQLGFLAPHFQLKGLDGKTYEVKGKRSKPLVLNFWASWCGYCVDEAPLLSDYHLKYKDKIDMFAVNTEGSRGNVEAAKAFVKQYKFEMPVPVDADGKVADAYHVVGIPVTYFIDAEGVIRNIVPGGLDEATLKKNMEALLKK